MKKDITAKLEWDTDELPVEFYQLRKQHLEQSPQSKSRGMHVFVKPLTIEKLEVLSWIAGVNKSQCLNLLLDDNDVFTYLASAALRHAKKAEVNDARRFRVLARTEERRNGLGQLNIESQELYSHLKDKEAFFQEYAYIRCLQEFYFGNGELDKWSQETNRLDRMLKILVSNRGSFLVNGSFMDFVSSMEYKYELFREDMLKQQFLVTDEELQSKYKYANPLINSDVFTSDDVSSATSERTPSILESEASNLLESDVSASAALSEAENTGKTSSIPITLNSSLSDAETSGVPSSILANSDSSSSDSETTSTIQDSSHAQNSRPTLPPSTVSNSNTVPNSFVAKSSSISDLSSVVPEYSDASSTISESSEYEATSSTLSKLDYTLHTLQDSSASRLSSAVALPDSVTTLTTSWGTLATTRPTLNSGLDTASLSIAKTTSQTTSRHALESEAASRLSNKPQGKQEHGLQSHNLQSHRLHSLCQPKNSNSAPAPQAVASQVSNSQAPSRASLPQGATSRVFLSQDHVLHVPQALTLDSVYPEQASLVLSSAPSRAITLPTEIKPASVITPPTEIKLSRGVKPSGKIKSSRGRTSSSGIKNSFECSVQQLSAETESETEYESVVSQHSFEDFAQHPLSEYAESSVTQLYSTEQPDGHTDPTCGQTDFTCLQTGSTCGQTDSTCSTVMFKGQVKGSVFTKSDEHTLILMPLLTNFRAHALQNYTLQNHVQQNRRAS